MHTQRTNTPPGARLVIRLMATPLLMAWLVVAVSACFSVPISYYDATTYKNLTALKAESVLLLEQFDIESIEVMAEKIDGVSLRLRQAYEYERGKGDPNSDTARQFRKIVELYEEDIATYRADGPGALGPAYFSEAAAVLGQAFDIAIATENLKNSDKR